MKTYKPSPILLGLILTMISYSLLNGQSKLEEKYSKIFHNSSLSIQLLLEKESLLKIDDEVIYPKEVKKKLRELDTSIIIDVKIYSNSKTVEEKLEDNRSELIVISTSNQTSDLKDSINGYDFIKSKLSHWLDSHPNPMIVFDGRLFKYESEYKPLLQELNKTDIYAIDTLNDDSAMRVLNYKSVILITTKQRK